VAQAPAARLPHPPAEGSNAELQLNRLRQDVYEQLVDHGNPEAPRPDRLQLTPDQFYHSFWSQARGCGVGGGGLSDARARNACWPI
jgi:hypothetical protein